MSIFAPTNGVLAQLVERLNGIQKVRSSILLCSTKSLSEYSEGDFSYSAAQIMDICPNNNPAFVRGTSFLVRLLAVVGFPHALGDLHVREYGRK